MSHKDICVLCSGDYTKGSQETHRFNCMKKRKAVVGHHA